MIYVDKNELSSTIVDYIRNQEHKESNAVSLLKKRIEDLTEYVFNEDTKEFIDVDDCI